MTRTRMLALLTTLLASAPALAADWKADITRYLGDPSFLPVAGQVEGRFGYTYTADLFDGRTNSADIFFGDRNSSYDRSENAFGAFLFYGVTDDVSLFASLNFGNDRTREAYSFQRSVFRPRPPLADGRFGIGFRNPGTFVTETVLGAARFHSVGAGDPSFGATWRVLDQASAPVSVDITGSYAPDIFQARSAGLDQTGSLAPGGQSGTIQAAVSRELHVLTLRAYGGATYVGRENDRAVGGFDDLRSAPHAVYTAGVQSEVRVLPWLAINAGVGAQQAVRYDRFDVFPGSGTSVSTTIKPSGMVSPYIGAVIPLLDDHVVSEFQYQHDFISDETEQQAGFSTVRFTHQSANSLTARILFAFGGAAPALPPPPPASAPPIPAAVAAPRTYLVFFDWDRADLTARARQIVAQAAQASTQAATTRIEVSGYTDLSGTAAYNARLSVRRAASVAAELVQDGVPRGEIAVHGFGESSPLVPTAPGVREPQNRRVEIVLR